MTSPPHIKSKAIYFELLVLFACLLFYVCVFFVAIIHDAVSYNGELGLTLCGGVWCPFGTNSNNPNSPGKTPTSLVITTCQEAKPSCKRMSQFGRSPSHKR